MPDFTEKEITYDMDNGNVTSYRKECINVHVIVLCIRNRFIRLLMYCLDISAFGYGSTEFFFRDAREIEVERDR